MKIEDLPLSLRELVHKFKKLFISLIIIITIFMSLGIFIFKDFGLGYKYYETNENIKIYIGATLKENFLEKTINEYIEELTNKGYYIVSSSLNKTFIDRKTIVPKPLVNDSNIKKDIIRSLNVSILCTKLTIKGDKTIYYFKTQKDCNKFVQTLNKYVKQKYNSVGSTEDYKIITSEKVLNAKVNSVKQEKIENEKRIITVATTSRSSTLRSTNYLGGVPMATYVYISSPYGYRHGSLHTGTDFAAPSGTSVYAWKDGTITKASWNGNYGNFISIKHNDGTVSRYAHLSGYNCSVGQKVAKGQTIGYVGSTGNSTGAHLHFEIMINGSFVNPINYL